MNILKTAAAVIAALAVSSTAHAQQAFTIQIDGSSTVFPLSEAVAEAFQQQTQGRVRVTVGESGTGGGFRKFCRGETHISDASRPITASEMATCRSAGIQYVEIPVAFDALTVVVNPSNPVRSITVQELQRTWRPEAQGNITNWRQINPSYPDLPLVLFGAGTASGTFDYFTEAIVGRSRSSRTDYTPTEDDNVTVQGVASNPGGMGYFGLAYLHENQGRLRGLAIDNGSGPIEPNVQNAENGSYNPLSRPMFIYVNAAALRRPQVQQFVQFYVNNAGRFATQVGYIPLPANAYQTYLQRTRQRTQGTAFGGRQAIGITIAELMARPLVVEPVQQ
jgi:phosphate transport system substrate-binding protein